jgi:DNA-directed RNA polymerase specialized sigma subunit
VPEDRPADPVAELWSEYKQHHPSDARERLILHYAPLVKFVAGRVASGLPQSVEQADLVGYGIYYEGLTLSEIGDVLGVTESRACQIHTKAILQLRARLGAPEGGRVR